MSETMPDDLSQHIRHTHQLFADVRARFTNADIDRGGHERPNITPIYVKKFSMENLRQLYPTINHYSVEASFNEEQLGYVNDALLAFRERVVGGPLAERIVQIYLHETSPLFVPALLRASEGTLRELIAAAPQHAAALEALFIVAGGEGLRDVVQLYGSHFLEQTLEGKEPNIPDLLAFVDVHERIQHAPQPRHTRYEVWCPGTDLAKEMLRQCATAAKLLVEEHGIHISMPLRAEVASLPHDLPQHLRAYVQQLTAPVFREHGVGG